MPKIQDKSSILLGQTRLGKPLRIPKYDDYNKLFEFIPRTPIDEQIDLFCISEALSLHYQQRKTPFRDQDLMEKVLAFFITKMENTEFLSVLQDQGLILSIDRANLGRELCLYL